MSERSPQPDSRTAASDAAKLGISPVFLVLSAVFLGAGYELGVGHGGTIGVFVLVLIGWIITLCLHEFGHAATAWAGGDRSIEERGYLTLNPLKYAHPLLSIVMPLALLAIGSIGFPGGAVYVNKDALRGPLWRAGVSAAGPAMNVLCLAAIALALHAIDNDTPLASGLAFLGYLQVTAVMVNLLPIPGLDGFGILESVFSEKERLALEPIRRFVWFAFLAVIYAAPSVLAPLSRAAVSVCAWLGVDAGRIGDGYDLFQFWSLQ